MAAWESPALRSRDTLDPGPGPGQTPGLEVPQAPRGSRRTLVTGLRVRTACPRALGSPGLVKLRVDRARRLRGHARDALELLLRRREHLLDRAEVLQERPPPRRADALELVEERAEASRLAALAVEADGEAVRLVAQPLQELQPRRVAREHDRVGPAGHVDLLDPLGERDHRDAGQVVRLHGRQGGGELALA